MYAYQFGLSNQMVFCEEYMCALKNSVAFTVNVQTPYILFLTLHSVARSCVQEEGEESKRYTSQIQITPPCSQQQTGGM